MENINIKKTDGSMINVEPIMAFNNAGKNYLLFVNGKVEAQGKSYNALSVNEISNDALVAIQPETAPIISEIIRNCGSESKVNQYEPIDIKIQYDQLGEAHVFAASDDSLNTLRNYFASTGKTVTSGVVAPAPVIEEPTFNPFATPVTPVEEAPVVNESPIIPTVPVEEPNPFIAPVAPVEPVPAVQEIPVAPVLPAAPEINPFVTPAEPVPAVPEVPVAPAVENTVEVSNDVAPVIGEESLTVEQIIAGLKEANDIYKSSIEYYENALAKLNEKNNNMTL